MATEKQLQDAVSQAAAALGLQGDESRKILGAAIGKAADKAEAVTDSEAIKLLKERLEKAAEGWLAKMGIDLGKKVITIRQGEVNGKLLVDVAYPRQRKGGNGTGRNAPTRHGKSHYDGKEYASPSAVAKALGLKITGHRDMRDVFESQGYTVSVDDGDNYHVAKKDGKPAPKAEAVKAEQVAEPVAVITEIGEPEAEVKAETPKTEPKRLTRAQRRAKKRQA